MTAVPTPVLPSLFRWVSSSRTDVPALTFSVPASLLPGSSLEVPSNSQPQHPVTKSIPLCDMGGCTLPRKYKLVKDPTKGGCGLAHLKALEVS